MITALVVLKALQDNNPDQEISLCGFPVRELDFADYTSVFNDGEIGITSPCIIVAGTKQPIWIEPVSTNGIEGCATEEYVEYCGETFSIKD